MLEVENVYCYGNMIVDVARLVLITPPPCRDNLTNIDHDSSSRSSVVRDALFVLIWYDNG